MATVFIQATQVCGSQGHAHLIVQVNGTPKGSVAMHVDQLDVPIRDEDIDTFVRMCVRGHKIGKTNAQVRADLVAGLTITL